MMRRPMQAPPMNGPRFNEWIQSQKVRVIDHEGENLGVMYTREAIEQASNIRLRPVMMTMICTVLGGVPLVLAAGAGAEARIAPRNAYFEFEAQPPMITP